MEWWQHLPSGVLVSVDSVIRFANPAAAHILDVADAQDLLGQSFWNYIHPLDQHRIRGRVRRVEEHSDSVPVTEVRIFTARGQERVLAVRSSPLVHQGQSAIIATLTDMTDRAAIEHRLRESDTNFNRLMASLQDVYYRTDEKGNVRYLSAASEKIMGYTSEEAVGKPAALFYANDADRQLLLQEIHQHHRVYEFPTRLRHKDGRIIDVSVSSHRLVDENGQFAGVEGICRDVTESRRLQQQLQGMVVQDHLTGCLNRRGVMEFLSRCFQLRCAPGRRKNTPFSVLAIDVDRFKRINDSYGHLVGDMVLRGVVQRISEQCRPQDCFGRMGGEEFVVVLDDAAQPQAFEIAERIRKALEREPIVDGDVAIPVTISIGVSEYLPHDDSAMLIYERADQALYQAKGLGRNRVVAGQLPR